MKPEVIIDGQWLSAIMPWGDLEWSTCWPGGTEAITFGVARNHRLFRPDALVELDYGGIRLAVGAMVEPTRGEPLLAEGLHRKGEDEPALNGAGDAIIDYNCVEHAINRGLPWVRVAAFVTGSSYDLWPSPGVSGSAALDLTTVHSIAQYMDAAAMERSAQWGIEPGTRRVFVAGWDATPSFHMLPGVDGLAISRDGYASTLIARYLDSGTSTYKTVSRTDLAAQERWGRVPRTIVDLLGEGVAMTTARAETLVDGLLAQGWPQIGWATPLEVQYGDLVTEHGQPVDLNRIYARQTIRLHGLIEDIADLSGQTWVDMPIARTRHKTGVVTIEPRGLSSPMNDALAGTPA